MVTENMIREGAERWAADEGWRAATPLPTLDELMTPLVTFLARLNIVREWIDCINDYEVRCPAEVVEVARLRVLVDELVRWSACEARAFIGGESRETVGDAMRSLIHAFTSDDALTDWEERFTMPWGNIG